MLNNELSVPRLARYEQTNMRHLLAAGRVSAILPGGVDPLREFGVFLVNKPTPPHSDNFAYLPGGRFAYEVDQSWQDYLWSQKMPRGRDLYTLSKVGRGRKLRVEVNQVNDGATLRMFPRDLRRIDPSASGFRVADQDGGIALDALETPRTTTPTLELGELVSGGQEVFLMIVKQDLFQRGQFISPEYAVVFDALTRKIITVQGTQAVIELARINRQWEERQRSNPGNIEDFPTS